MTVFIYKKHFCRNSRQASWYVRLQARLSRAGLPSVAVPRAGPQDKRVGSARPFGSRSSSAIWRTPEADLANLLRMHGHSAPRQTGKKAHKAHETTRRLGNFSPVQRQIGTRECFARVVRHSCSSVFLFLVLTRALTLPTFHTRQPIVNTYFISIQKELVGATSQFF